MLGRLRMALNASMIVDSVILKKVVIWVFWDRHWYVRSSFFPGGCAQDRLKNRGETDYPGRKKLANGANFAISPSASIGCPDVKWPISGAWGLLAGRSRLGVPGQTLHPLQCTCCSLQLPSSHTHKLLKRSFIHLSLTRSIKSGPRVDGELGKHLPCEFMPSYLVPSYTT